MECITKEQMFLADQDAINSHGLTQKKLMENAGLKVFESVINFWGCPQKICVLCGRGNNGGDAKIAAEHFKIHGAEVEIIFAESPNAISSLEKSLKNSDLVIDGLFGIGLNKDISGDNEILVDLINRNKFSDSNPKRLNYRVVSVDIPSGLNADTGQVMGICVNADLTVTFHAPKVGMLTSNGINLCGRIIVADIGIPYKSDFFSFESKVFLADHLIVKRTYKYRKTYSNKSDNGKTLVFASSNSMAGASILCSRSAIRAGAGLIYQFVPRNLQPFINISVPESIVFSYDDLSKLRAINFSAVIAGPGIGRENKSMLKKIIKETKSSTIIFDADALNIIAEDESIIKKINRKVVLTPHPAEMARLLKCSVEEVQNDRIKASNKAAEKFNAVVVLKGLNTVVSEPLGRTCVVSAGNPSLATGGSGDVLAGIIGAIIGQGADVFESAVSGAYIHGMAADIVRSLKGETGVSPLDIIDAIPYFIKGCCDGKQRDT